MNVNPETWHGLGISRDSARDPEKNIMLGARLIREIWDRLENPSARKVAALWHFMGAEFTDNADVRNFVARVGRVLEKPPWDTPQESK